MSKIIELNVSNFMGVKLASVRPDGNVVVIGGANEQGKTSLLTAILAGIKGARFSPDDPIHGVMGDDGEMVYANQAELELIIGTDDEIELKVRRRFTKKGGSITVKNAEGLSYPSPQAILDRLASLIAYDPLSLARADIPDQVAIVQALVGLDLQKLDDRLSSAIEDRREKGASLKQTLAVRDSMPYHEGLPDAPPNVEALLEELRAVNAHNDTKGALEAQSKALNDKNEVMVKDQAALESKIADMKLTLEGLELDLTAGVAGLSDHHDKCIAKSNEVEAFVPQDPKPIEAQIESAGSIAEKLAANAARDEIIDQGNIIGAKHKELDELVSHIRDERLNAIADAEIPVEGMSFDSNGVTLDGVPFKQCSSAQQLKASVAIGIAMKPKLTVMLVREGAFLDEKSMAFLAETAEFYGHQIWIERVGSADEGAILIEEGRVVGAAGDEDGNEEEQEEGELGREAEGSRPAEGNRDGAEPPVAS